MIGAAFADEQASILRKAERSDVAVQHLEELRRTRYWPGLADLALFEQPVVAMGTGVGPLVAGIWPGPFEVDSPQPSLG